MPVIRLALGDLIRQDVDAVVDAADHGLLGGGGVDVLAAELERQEG